MTCFNSTVSAEVEKMPSKEIMALRSHCSMGNVEKCLELLKHKDSETIDHEREKGVYNWRCIESSRDPEAYENRYCEGLGRYYDEAFDKK